MNIVRAGGFAKDVKDEMFPEKPTIVFPDILPTPDEGNESRIETVDFGAVRRPFDNF